MPLAALPFDARLDMVGRIEQEGERRFEHRGNLRLMRRQNQIGRHHADHRRHLEAGDGAIAISGTDDGDLVTRQADLFLGLAKRRGDRIGIAGIDTTAGKGDLAGMAAERFGALREDHAGIRPIGDRHEHGGVHRRFGDIAPFVSVTGKQDQLRRWRVQRAHQSLRQDHAAPSIAKKAPSLQTPGGVSPLASAISASS